MADVPPVNRGTNAANLEQVMQSDDMICYSRLSLLWPFRQIYDPLILFFSNEGYILDSFGGFGKTSFAFVRYYM